MVTLHWPVLRNVFAATRPAGPAPMMQIVFFAAAMLWLTLTKRSGRIWRDLVKLAFFRFSKKNRGQKM